MALPVSPEPPVRPAALPHGSARAPSGRWRVPWSRESAPGGLFFLAAALLIGGVNLIFLGPEWQVRYAPSYAFSGDEPHYLLVIHSLLEDGDLRLEEDYVRAAAGGLGAGQRFKGRLLDHHTLVFDPETGQTRSWHAVFRADAPLFAGKRPVGFPLRASELPPGPSAQETSAHPVAFPALVALVLAPFRLEPESIERAVSLVQQGFCWLGALVVYGVGLQAGFSRRQALAASALLLLASPWLAYSRSFFSEPAIALALMVGLWALRGRYPVVASVAVSIAMAMKPPFVLVGAAWVLSRLWARRWGEALRLVSGLLAGGVLLLAFNQWQSHVWLVSGTSGWVWARGLSSLNSTLLHPSYGLLTFVPWAVLAIPSLVRSGGGGERPALTRELAWPLALYLGVLSASAFTGGSCYGPRYWIAVMPWLALAAVESARRWGRTGWVGIGLMAMLAAWLCWPGALRYGQVWDRPARQGWPSLGHAEGP